MSWTFQLFCAIGYTTLPRSSQQGCRLSMPCLSEAAKKDCRKGAIEGYSISVVSIFVEKFATENFEYLSVSFSEIEFNTSTAHRCSISISVMSIFVERFATENFEYLSVSFSGIESNTSTAHRCSTPHCPRFASVPASARWSSSAARLASVFDFRFCILGVCADD